MMTYEDKLYEIAKDNDAYIVMTAENRAFIRKMPELLGERFIDTGITEQTLVGAAAGLALRGRRPVLHALATFLTMRAFEFIRTDVGIPGLPVKLVGAFPGVLSEANGPTHQAIEDISLMRGIPNMGVFCPADLEDLVIGLESILESERPFYIRYPNLPANYQHSNNFSIGSAETCSEGDDITILTYGALFTQAFEAAQALQKKGLSVQLLNLRTLKPLDDSAVLDSFQKTKLTVTVEDHFQIGGLYSILAELLLKNKLSGNVLPIAFDERWFKPALLKDVLEYEKITAEHLANRIKSAYEKLT